MSFPPIQNCRFLTGPTGSGKTGAGVELAQKSDAEIISMDSMALYRGMDIGTAKPTAVERAAVPHHLVDVIGPHEEYSVAQYVAAAHEVAAGIRACGRNVLFVGGTPLYLKALLRGLFCGPPADPAFRRELQEESRRHDPGWLHARLAEVDPAAAERLHPNDTRRIIRALEVYEKTGAPMSDWQQQFNKLPEETGNRVYVLDWPRQELNERIDRRVDAMFAAGLVEEVRGLMALDPPLGKTARQAVGYREVIDHLEGACGLDETIALVKQHTRQLAKRQGTWFRSLPESRYVAMGGLLAERTGPLEW
ncbi:MAG: tRNA (adenosine(37)-N6)-dimethylallyltransferase MiaA [Thermoguttaceae bacterium]|jgi:tRNA dimethylallyltransferase|nr:tRNA (adenosine(37)-N6)-dimethylallyltransferase MiaA [Thermoguttaceae bacterium]